MKISDPAQKVVLHKLFLELKGHTEDGKPVYQPRQFPLDKLMDASSAAKKLLEGARVEDEMLYFSDSEAGFTPAEVAILIDLFDGVTTWEIGAADGVLGLMAIFQGKDGVKEKAD